jgi:hypothetical protein
MLGSHQEPIISPRRNSDHDGKTHQRPFLGQRGPFFGRPPMAAAAGGTPRCRGSRARSMVLCRTFKAMRRSSPSPTSARSPISAARSRRKMLRHRGCKGAARVLSSSSCESDSASIRVLQGAARGAAGLVSSARFAARESTLAGDRDGIADMRGVEHDREYGSFREFLSAVAVAPEGLICVLLK